MSPAIRSSPTGRDTVMVDGRPGPDQVVLRVYQMAVRGGAGSTSAAGCWRSPAFPGTTPDRLAVFDPWTGFLLTGDTVYPGRLYAREPGPFAMSMEHLVEFADARPVTHVMGCHIEQSRTPRRDYPIGCTYQPNEAPLQMTMAQLHAVRDATRAVRTGPASTSSTTSPSTTAPAVGAGAARVLLTRVRNAVSPP